MGEEAHQEEVIEPELISEAPTVNAQVSNLVELGRDRQLDVPSLTQDDIDISMLTQVIRPIADLIETDMSWDYVTLQAEIGQAYREKYCKKNPEDAEGLKL